MHGSNGRHPVVQTGPACTLPPPYILRPYLGRNLPDVDAVARTRHAPDFFTRVRQLRATDHLRGGIGDPRDRR